MVPIAYLLRSTPGKGKPVILCGQMFVQEHTARAAAHRLTNRWRTVEVVPVMEATDAPKVGDGSGDAAIAIGEDAFRAGWAARWPGHDTSVDAAWSAYDPPEHIKALS